MKKLIIAVALVVASAAPVMAEGSSTPTDPLTVAGHMTNNLFPFVLGTRSPAGAHSAAERGLSSRESFA
jgi:hypothetical protein